KSTPIRSPYFSIRGKVSPDVSSFVCAVPGSAMKKKLMKKSKMCAFLISDCISVCSDVQYPVFSGFFQNSPDVLIFSFKSTSSVYIKICSTINEAHFINVHNGVIFCEQGFTKNIFGSI